MPFVIAGAACAVIAIAAVLLLRAAAFRPREEEELRGGAEIPVTGLDGSVGRFSQLLQKQTVSSRDSDNVFIQQFDEFIALLPVLYPVAHVALTRELVTGHSLLYRWEGAGEGSPAVLMAHYDVVPASPEGWEQPPFGGIVKDGVIWGRGSIDTKVTLASIFEAVERLVSEGFKPCRDIYLSFGHDEEIGGVAGTPSIVALLMGRGIEPAMVLDEGGAVVSNIFPGVDRPIAVIGAAEKGRTDLELVTRGAGGHASTPPKDDAAARLARAVVRLDRKPFRPFFSSTTLEMLDTLGRYTPFGLRLIFANLWLFRPLLLHMFTKNGGETNAMCRTTFAVTMLEGSSGANILPVRVRAVANIRNAVGETVEEGIEYIRRVTGDDKLELNVIFSAEPSPVSDTKSAQYLKIKETIGETYSEAVVTPYIMVAQSDSRHYGGICRNIFRFSPLELTKKERESMHNVNECLPVAKFGKCIEFYIRLIKKL